MFNTELRDMPTAKAVACKKNGLEMG
jgi:hypothetical protein